MDGFSGSIRGCICPDRRLCCHGTETKDSESEAESRKAGIRRSFGYFAGLLHAGRRCNGPSRGNDRRGGHGAVPVSPGHAHEIRSGSYGRSGYGAVFVGSDYARAFGTAVIAGAVMGLFL